MQDRLKLPRVEDAYIPIEKLKDYCLDPDHGTGRHKARVFQAALGIGQEDWEYLRDQILEKLPRSDPIRVRDTRWGLEYEISVPIDGLNGVTRVVTTAWMAPTTGEAPWLTSAYIES